MTIGYGNSAAVLGTNRQLSLASSALDRAQERLASGQRINHASDDAAGLAVASSLEVSSRIFGQASRNVNDVISALSIAQGTIQSLTTIITRQRELAEQAANGVYSSQQRSALDNEARKLTDEYNRIVATTTFNGQQLVNGSTTVLSAQIGIGTGSTLDISLPNLASVASTTSGTGTFQSAVTTNIGRDLGQVVAGDFNGDGKQDLAVAIYSDFAIGILLGNGNGTFKALTTYTAGGAGTPLMLSSDDVNGDGVLDIVSGNNSGTGVSVLLGNGNGTFGVSITYGTTGDTHAVTISDLNGDGAKDLVVGTGFGNNYFGVLINNGNGTFKSESNYVVGTVGAEADEQWIADVNGDSKVDILSTARNDATVSVLFGNGNGTFQSPVSYAFGGRITDVVMTDANRDQVLDMVAIDLNFDTLYVRLGNSDGTFKVATSYATPNGSPSFLTQGDYNGDGISDLLVTSYYTTEMQVLLGNGNGSFKRGVSLATPAALHENPPALADFNGDGVADIAVGSWGTAGVGPDPVSLFIANIQVNNQSLSVDLQTQTSARTSLDSLATVLSNLANETSKIGASMSRLGFANEVLRVQRENYLAAKGRITDADVASEASERIRAQILQQSAISMLSQTSRIGELALTLLR